MRGEAGGDSPTLQDIKPQPHLLIRIVSSEFLSEISLYARILIRNLSIYVFVSWTLR